MTLPHPESPAASDRTFRGAREVVLVEGESRFRALPSAGPERVFLHGDVLGEDPVALAGREHVTDALGRFVLVLHDPARRTLRLRADRFGLVPLLRATRGGRLFFSTRIRPLVERGVVAGDPDEAALADFLAFHLATGARSLVQGVECVAAGASLTIDLDTLAVRETRDWDPAALLRAPRRSLAESADALVGAFVDATRTCLAGAGDPAVTLSGGLDTRCLLAAALAAGREPAAYHVGVPGSRAERYTRRIAGAAGVQLRTCALDAGFPARYLGLLERVVDATDGMKFAPQPEMLWLRDSVDPRTVVLHGAFGELSKLRVLRDFRLDEATARAGRAALADALWPRFDTTFRANLRIFGPEVRARLEPLPRRHLRELFDSFDRDLDVSEVLQLAYLREFVKSARWGHELWNEHVPTRFPFLSPPYVDRLLRLATGERLAPRVQHHLLRELGPALFAVPDENTGTAPDAPRIWKQLVRVADRARIALFDSKVDANHGELVAWIHRMQPAPEELVAQWGGDPFWDRAHLEGLVRVVHETCERPRTLRAASRRRAHRAAQALQTFFVTELWRRSLRGAFGSRGALHDATHRPVVGGASGGPVAR